MSIELGHFALILAFAIAAVSAVMGLVFWKREAFAGYLQQAALLQFLLVAAAFGARPGRALKVVAKASGSWATPLHVFECTATSLKVAPSGACSVARSTQCCR